MVSHPISNMQTKHNARSAVIGLGQMGLQHAAILSVLTGQRVCVHESNARLLNMVSMFAANLCVHSDLNDLLHEEELRSVFVCTPVQTHSELGRAIMEETSSQVSLFVEKPLAANHRSAKELATIADRGGRMVMVGFQKRFNGVYLKLKELVQNDALGEVKCYRAHSFSYDVTRRSKGWKFEPPFGGVTLDFGVHVIDIITWLFGEPMVSHSFRSNLFSKGVEDYVHADLEHNDIVGTLDVGWSMRNFTPSDHELEIQGTNGTAVASDEKLTIYLENDAKPYLAGTHTFYKSELTPKPPYLLTYPEYVLEDVYFLKSTQTGTSPSPSFQQAALVNKVVDEIRNFQEPNR